MQALSLATVKARLSEFVDSVHREHDRVTITRNGVPVAVLISAEDLESLEETLDLLRDPQALADIRESEEAVSRGDYETYSSDEDLARLRREVTGRARAT